ncbi:MAG: type II secretion system protein N [Candidatus Omnitrophota bacterium]
MKDDISPEERLLHLIKTPKNRNIATSSKQVSSSEKNTVLSSEIPIIDKKSVKKITVLDFKAKYLTIFSLRNIIIFIVVLSLIYLIYSLVYSLFLVKTFKTPVIVSSEKTQQEEKAQERKEAPSLEFYLEETGNRQIFNSPVAAKENKASAAVTSDLLKNLNLVGIIAGENPQAIIEDKKAQKTYYLQKGQFIEEYEITDIQEGKIVLTNNGQKYELYL